MNTEPCTERMNVLLAKLESLIDKQEQLYINDLETRLTYSSAILDRLRNTTSITPDHSMIIDPKVIALNNEVKAARIFAYWKNTKFIDPLPVDSAHALLNSKILDQRLLDAWDQEACGELAYPFNQFYINPFGYYGRDS